MIKINNGNVKIDGTQRERMYDLYCLYKVMLANSQLITDNNEVIRHMQEELNNDKNNLSDSAGA